MGLFFSFDGIDGVGKSTQLTLFCDWLRLRDVDLVACRDPGSTPLGERLREILLESGPEAPIAPRSEMLLYMAARAQLVDQVIRPALTAGRVVVSDRYLLANIAYQGHAGGLPLEQVRSVGATATDGICPDCTFLLDMDPIAAVERLVRPLDRMEQRGAAYREQLRNGFLAEALLMGQTVHVIDAARSVEEVHEDLCAIADPLLARHRTF